MRANFVCLGLFHAVVLIDSVLCYVINIHMSVRFLDTGRDKQYRRHLYNDTKRGVV